MDKLIREIIKQAIIMALAGIIAQEVINIVRRADYELQYKRGWIRKA